MTDINANKHKKTLCIDFDGTIHSFDDGWQDGSLYGFPVEGSVKALTKLKKAGYKVVIFTTRTEFDLISDWLNKYNIPFDEVTNIKVPALAYIDDRGIRFTGNWEDVIKYFI